MSVYIKGMEMPKEGSWKTVRIYPDGTCAVPNWQGDCTFIQGAQAVPVPPHGRLIDADAMEKTMSDTVQGDIRGYPYSDTLWDMAFRWIDHQPTIIEAEEGE